MGFTLASTVSAMLLAWSVFAGGVQPATAEGRTSTRFGIFYSGWHCPVSESRLSSAQPGQIRDVSRILQGEQTWGALDELHWWGRPREGYYCLAADDGLLARHAEQLRDAGIDFIFYDATNWADLDAYRRRDPTAMSVVDSFTRLLTVWRTVPDAPKVVVWTPITTSASMVDHLQEEMNRIAPELYFIHVGKPLLLAVDEVPWFKPDPSRIDALEARYTVRLMWSKRDPDPGKAPPHLWSYMERCGEGFKASRGTEACGQRYSTRRDGGREIIEQVPVASAYQYHQLMTDRAHAVPKLNGMTFWQQFRRAYELSPELVMITGWNEWIAQRGCRDGNAAPLTNYIPGPDCRKQRLSETMPDGTRVFADLYDAEYNRDIEPASGQTGSRYYELMARCIADYKAGRLCDPPVRELTRR